MEAHPCGEGTAGFLLSEGTVAGEKHEPGGRGGALTGTTRLTVTVAPPPTQTSHLSLLKEMQTRKPISSPGLAPSAPRQEGAVLLTAGLSLVLPDGRGHQW